MLPEWLRDRLKALVKGQLERREAPRKLVANLTAHYWEGSGAASHVVRDISASGAFIYAEFQWLPGTIVTMTLQWEGQVVRSGSPVAVVVRGKVVRHAQSGVGVQFLYSDKREQTKLATFLQGALDARPS
ncbi:MAG: PilZ domain-containing protein [Bryobacteraceae bacterium]